MANNNLTAKKRVLKSGRIGNVINSIKIKNVGIMLELSFEGRVYTECFFENETEDIE